MRLKRCKESASSVIRLEKKMDEKVNRAEHLRAANCVHLFESTGGVLRIRILYVYLCTLK